MRKPEELLLKAENFDEDEDKLEEVLKLYQESIDADPLFTKAYYFKAQKLFRYDRYQEAANILKEIPETDDMYFDCQIKLLQIHLYAKDTSSYNQVVDSLDKKYTEKKEYKIERANHLI